MTNNSITTSRYVHTNMYPFQTFACEMFRFQYASLQIKYDSRGEDLVRIQSTRIDSQDVWIQYMSIISMINFKSFHARGFKIGIFHNSVWSDVLPTNVDSLRCSFTCMAVYGLRIFRGMCEGNALNQLKNSFGQSVCRYSFLHCDNRKNHHCLQVWVLGYLISATLHASKLQNPNQPEQRMQPTLCADPRDFTCQRDQLCRFILTTTLKNSRDGDHLRALPQLTMSPIDCHFPRPSKDTPNWWDFAWHEMVVSSCKIPTTVLLRNSNLQANSR